MTTAASIESLRSALEQTGRLLQSNPAEALQRARIILSDNPGHAAAQQLEGSALRLLGRPAPEPGPLPWYMIEGGQPPEPESAAGDNEPGDGRSSVPR